MTDRYPPPENSQPPYPPEFRQETPTPSTPSPPQRVPVRLPTATPYVTYTLTAVTVLIYLIQLVSDSLLGVDILAAYGSKVNDLILTGEFWRLFTPMLLHGSILHIGFNMYALNIFGRGLERHFGHWRFFALYFLSGFAGNVISFMFTESPSLGSSTAIFGLLGAQGIFIYQNQRVFGGIARRALNNIIMVAVINLVIGLSPGIDNWGHVGGLVGGTLFAWITGPQLEVEGVYPTLSVVDKRDPSDTLRAIFIVGGFFAFLVVGAFFLQGR